MRNDRGYTYLITNGTHYKIGITTGTPVKRIAELQTGSPTKISISAYCYNSNALVMEIKLHKKFSSKRLEGEWFALNDDDVAIIHNHFENNYLDECFAPLSEKGVEALKRETKKLEERKERKEREEKERESAKRTEQLRKEYEEQKRLADEKLRKEQKRLADEQLRKEYEEQKRLADEKLRKGLRHMAVQEEEAAAKRKKRTKIFLVTGGIGFLIALTIKSFWLFIISILFVIIGATLFHSEVFGKWSVGGRNKNKTWK